MMNNTLSRRFVMLMGVLVALVCGAGRAEAQDAFYTLDQVSQQPRLASPTRTADLLRTASKGVEGTVRVQFVVGADGKVEEGTVKVVHSTNATLAAAAEKVAPRLEFRPGEKDGKSVRTQVTLPLTFQ